ncbi:unnamed protein product [Cylicostephanus goldi]|uniref:Uncharacterized protein n=1 Tax=Cylicostephanus goldi TaxID=71465 RepID=A0A3P6SLP8_CYLGO|nr:unnamed protein product [Cylicostephanus goldi]
MQPLPTTAPTPPSPHITTIPISAVMEKSSSPMEEKFSTFPDASSEQPSSRSSSRIPKYVLTSMEKEQTNEPGSKVSSAPTVSPPPAKPSNHTDLVIDRENVSPTSLNSPSNPKPKPNTGIPKPSKIRPPSTRQVQMCAAGSHSLRFIGRDPDISNSEVF